MAVRVRFAPSPTGHLHVGNVRTALFNWLLARSRHGAFVLRIEDTDLARSERRFEDQLLEDLKWLGLTWDEGVDVGGSFGPYRQTDRLELYRDLGQRLLQENKAYYCFCTPEALELERRRQLEEGRPVRYVGRCRNLSQDEAISRFRSGEEATLRIKVRDGLVGFDDLVFGHLQIDCAEIGDFVLLRSDGRAQYNFACVVDDALMKISHVVRGEGHLSNTHRQILIYKSLDFLPPIFAHLSTILGRDGTKLSKRHGATSIEELRNQGFLPEALVNYLALLGWAPREDGNEILSLGELIQEFELERVNRHPATFDPDKLKWVNRHHLKAADRERLVRLVIPLLEHAGLIPSDPNEEVVAWIGFLVEALLNYLETLNSIVYESRDVFQFNAALEDLGEEERQLLRDPSAKVVVEAFSTAVQSCDSFDGAVFREILSSVKKQTAAKGKELYHPIRFALTGRTSGPELEKLVLLIDEGSRLVLSRKIPGVRERVSRVLQLFE